MKKRNSRKNFTHKIRVLLQKEGDEWIEMNGKKNYMQTHTKVLNLIADVAVSTIGISNQISDEYPAVKKKQNTNWMPRIVLENLFFFLSWMEHSMLKLKHKQNNEKSNALVTNKWQELNCTILFFRLLLLTAFFFRICVYRMSRITLGTCTVNCSAMRLVSVRIHHCRTRSFHKKKIERRQIERRKMKKKKIITSQESNVSVCVRTLAYVYLTDRTCDSAP